MIFDLIDKTLHENKCRSKLKLKREFAVDASTWAQTLQGKHPRISKILQMLDKRARRRGTKAGARIQSKRGNARNAFKSRERCLEKNRAAKQNT